MTRPSYLFDVTSASGTTVYRYNPPKDAVSEGVAERKTLGSNYEEACAYAEEQNKLISEWRSERKYLKNLTSKSTVGDLIKSYKNSSQFSSLSEKTAVDYTYCIESWRSCKLGGVPLMSAKLGNIATPMCQRVYDDAADKSVSMANHVLTVYRMLFNYAIRKGFTNYNPFKMVETRRESKRKVVWEREHVRAFLNTAFSKFEWRNVGIIVHMAYEWGQRIGDMRSLRWDSYDVDTGVLTLTQSKRGANIQVPTSKGLQAMLKQQYEDFGWQEYIAPVPVSVRGKLKPYSMNNLYRVGVRIRESAELPSYLSLLDLRRTAITEMVEVGVPVPSIMAMSGHATPMSLTPYIKHTLRGATTAQTMRSFPEQLL